MSLYYTQLCGMASEMSLHASCLSFLSARYLAALQGLSAQMGTAAGPVDLEARREHGDHLARPPGAGESKQVLPLLQTEEWKYRV